MIESPMREDKTAEDNVRRQSVAEMARQLESQTASNTLRTGRTAYTYPAMAHRNPNMPTVAQEDYFYGLQNSTTSSAQQERTDMAGNNQSSGFWSGFNVSFLSRDRAPTSPPDPELMASPNSFSNDRHDSRESSLAVPAGDQRRNSNESTRSDYSQSNISDQHDLDATIQISEEGPEGNREDRGTSTFKLGFEKFKNLYRTRTKDASDFIVNATGDVVHVVKAVDEMKIISVLDLCLGCSKIPFGKIRQAARQAGSNVSGPEWSGIVFTIERILRWHGKCKFCEVLFEALCLERNDPLKHPTIRSHIQEGLRNDSFRGWAKRVNWWELAVHDKDIWPFGHSLDPKEAKKAAQEADAWGSTRSPSKVIKNRKDSSLLKIVNEVFPMMVATSKRALPCFVSIRLENNLLVVRVRAQGRAHGAAYDCVSQFNLTVGSDSPTARHYGRLLDPQRIDLYLASSWLHHCEKHHGKSCSEPEPLKLLPKPKDIPFRLIDVDKQRLVDADQLENFQYACLSYVWGDDLRATRLDKSTIQEFYESGSLNPSRTLIPRTISCAILATKGSGLAYLWVDRFCICQDNFEEKAAQIAQMDRIYGSASLTIVAADSEHADEGLQGVMDDFQRNITQIAAEVRPGVNVLVPVEQKSHLNPWDSRAWTLQEKLLSRRLLVFSGGQMHFHCQQGVLHEDMPAKDADNGYPAIEWISVPKNEAQLITSTIKTNLDGSTKLLRSPYFTQYVSLVEQYTRRRMSDPSDVLNAIDGLMKVLERSHRSSKLLRLSGQPHFGVPEEFLDLAILWQPSAAEGVRLRRRVMPKGKEIPSWAWASWEAMPKNTQSSILRNRNVKDLAWEGGVRYERPFQVFTDGTGAHMKVVPGTGDTEDRIRPVLSWYRWGKVKPPKPDRPKPPIKSHSSASLSAQSPMFDRPLASPRTRRSPVGTPLSPPTIHRPSSPAKEIFPLNATGLGLFLGGYSTPNDWTNGSELLSKSIIDRGDLPSDVLSQLDDRHLIFRTSTASFGLGGTAPRKEVLWKRFDQSKPQKEQERTPVKEFYISETEIVDENLKVVGRVVLPDPSKPPAGTHFDFIVISESQYFGDEDQIGDSSYRLYNVMLIEWNRQHTIATRVAVGKVYKVAWKNAGPKEQVIVLG